MKSLNQMVKSHTAIITLPLLIAAAALYIFQVAPAGAQVNPSTGRLRVVVRDLLGRGIAGLEVHVLRQQFSYQPLVAVASGVTDQRGVADFDTSDQDKWPTGGYQLRFAPGTSLRHFDSEAAQAGYDPPLGIEFFPGADDWAMYALTNEGRFAQDYSFNLKSVPRINPPRFPTPRPKTWDETVRARGITPVPDAPYAPTATPLGRNPSPGSNGPVANAQGEAGAGNLITLLAGGLIISVLWFARAPLLRIGLQLLTGRRSSSK